MPLTVNESKDVIIKMFRLVLAVSSKNDGEASKAFESIVNTIMTDDDDLMPPLEQCTERHTYVTATNDGVDLVIREEPVLAPQEPALTINTPRSYDYPRAQPATPCSDIEANDADDELESDEIGVEAVELNDEGEAIEEEAVEEEEEAVEEEEEAVDEEEEEVALNLEPVRIRKIIYWKDIDSGDLYQYLPDDEVGDKVGSYVNGVPVIP